MLLVKCCYGYLIRLRFPSYIFPRIFFWSQWHLCLNLCKMLQKNILPLRIFFQAVQPNRESSTLLSMFLYQTSERLCGCSGLGWDSDWIRQTDLLHIGHTLRISNHFSRHFLWKAWEQGHTPSSSLLRNSSKHTAHVWPRRLSFFPAPFKTTSL